jgi:hypothetical protein
VGGRILTCVEERLRRGLQAHLCAVRIAKRGLCNSVPYLVGLSFTPGLERRNNVNSGSVGRAIHSEMQYYTFVKAVQPTPMINTRSLPATMTVLKRLSEPFVQRRYPRSNRSNEVMRSRNMTNLQSGTCPTRSKTLQKAK